MRAKQQGIERSLFPELSPEEELIVQVLSRTNDLQVNIIYTRKDEYRHLSPHLPSSSRWR